MASVVLAIMAVGAGISAVVAEDNGAFVGLEIGSGATKTTGKGTDLAGSVWDLNLNITAASYGAKLDINIFSHQISVSVAMWD